MTDSAPAQPMLAYQTPEPPRRPTSVLVLSIIGIVMASLAILGFVVFFGLAIALRSVQAAALDLPGWQYLQYALSLVFNGLLLWLCVAALKLLPVARRGLVRWAWAYLAWVVFDFVVALVMSLLPMRNEEGVDEMWIAIGLYAGISLLSCVYPALWLAFLRKERVRAAFGSAGPDAGAAEVPTANLASALPPLPPVPERPAS